MTRKPAAASGSICWRQEYQNSGKPWRRTTTGPSDGPAATAWSWHAPLLKVKCRSGAGTSREFTPEREALGKRSASGAATAAGGGQEAETRMTAGEKPG